jgi:hypothetical protein
VLGNLDAVRRLRALLRAAAPEPARRLARAADTASYADARAAGRASTTGKPLPSPE